jgi:hypothetical protein
VDRQVDLGSVQFGEPVGGLPITGRYLRLTATKLGAPASDESTKFRLQLAEIVIE